MAVKSFAQSNPTEVAPTAQAELVPVTPAAVVPDTFFSNNESGVSGYVDKSMVTTPWVSLVHGVGDLSTKFTPGQIVLNSETVLPGEMNVVVIRMRTFLQQKPTKLQQKRLDAEDKLPARFDTPEQARSAGFQMRSEAYRLQLDPETPVVEWCADLDMLFECPADKTETLGDYFPLELGGKKYLYGKMRCKGKQFKLIPEKVITTITWNAKSKATAPDFLWKLTSRQGEEGGNQVHRLYISLLGRTSPEFKAEMLAYTK